MGDRKASAYSKKPVVPFTRISRKKGKAFIKTVPAQKIVKFHMGNESLFNEGKLPKKAKQIASRQLDFPDPIVPIRRLVAGEKCNSVVEWLFQLTNLSF